MLICTKCGLPLYHHENCYRCQQGHSFDIAKRGYVNLNLNNRKRTGDEKEMIQGRRSFLEKGYYQIFRDRLCMLLDQYQVSTLCDAGCGEGYYTNAFMQEGRQVFGFDLSKYGIDYACRSKKGVFYGVASVFRLPLKDACMDAVLSIFAPFDEKEMARVLKEHGIFIKVSPAKNHLMGMKKVLYEEVYENEAPSKTMEHFILKEEIIVEDVIHLSSQEDIWNLFTMTPYYHKTPYKGKEALQKQEKLTTEIGFVMQVYEKI